MEQVIEWEPLANNCNFQLVVTTSMYPNVGKYSEKRYERSLLMFSLL